MVHHKVHFLLLSENMFLVFGSRPHVNEDFINAVKSGVKEHILQENRVNRASKQSIALQMQSIRNRESKLLDMFLDGKCTQALYDEKSAGFKEEIKKLEVGLEQNSDVSKDVTTALNHIIEVAGTGSNNHELFDKLKKTRVFENYIIERCVDGYKCLFLLEKNLRHTAFCEGL